jgi:hypothetical protein
MAYKKKKAKRHGGLKFMAFVMVVVLLIMGFRMGMKTELGQRITGNREDHRVERTELRPRFSFAAAKLRVTVQSIYNNEGTTVDLTTTRDMSLDRQSSTVSSDVSIERTSTEVSPGVNAIPFDPLNAKYTQILTKLYQYQSPREGATSWTRSVIEPYYYGTPLDDHYIPMIDDIMGFELRALAATSGPAKAAPANAVSGLVRPAVDTPTLPPDATKTYSYDLDMQTYRRVAPILAGRTAIDAPPDAAVTLTLAFDDVGLLRFADVAVANSIATTLAQDRGPGHAGVYRYTIEVTEISGEPIAIDLPMNVVDEIPAETLPGTVI